MRKSDCHHSCPLHHASWTAGLVLCFLSCAAFSAVVINEIHYNGEPNTSVEEFVGLHNTASDPVDISGWSLHDGIDFTFGPGSVIPANGYVVVAERPLSLLSQFQVPAFGLYQGKLSFRMASVALLDATGGLVDEVTYKASFPWPVGADGTGPSMELIDPALDTIWAVPGDCRARRRWGHGERDVLHPAGYRLWRDREGRSVASSSEARVVATGSCRGRHVEDRANADRLWRR